VLLVLLLEVVFDLVVIFFEIVSGTGEDCEVWAALWRLLTVLVCGAGAAVVAGVLGVEATICKGAD